MFFSFYVVPNTVKYFSNYFPKCKQTLEKQSFSLKSFSFTNILRWRMFYVETNGALHGCERYGEKFEQTIPLVRQKRKKRRRRQRQKKREENRREKRAIEVKDEAPLMNSKNIFM